MKNRKLIKAVVILLGIEALANGVYQLLYTRKLYSDVTFQYSVLIRGMFSIVVGLLACFLPLRFAQIMWTVMLYVLAFYLLAVIIIIIPIKIGTTLIRLGGIVILGIGIAYVIYYIRNRPEVQEPIEVMDDISGDLEKSNE